MKNPFGYESYTTCFYNLLRADRNQFSKFKVFNFNKVNKRRKEEKTKRNSTIVVNLTTVVFHSHTKSRTF